MSAPPALASYVACGLVWLRLAPSAIALGVATAGTVPIWLGLALCLALAPVLALGVDAGPLLGAGLPALLTGVVRELCLGAAFAALATVPWLMLAYAVRSATASALPGLEPLSKLYGLSALALCVALGAPRAYVMALAGTLADVPVAALALDRAAWLRETLAALRAALQATLGLALPLWLALWLLDVTLALVARFSGSPDAAARQPLRAALGLLLFGLLLAPLSARAPLWLRGALTDARNVAVRLSR